jgi:DNA polymerase III gamma/tau subunit
MSLAVKYRPRSLDEVIGQRNVLKAIKKALSKKSYPHAWLFVGSSGTGKTTCARILANIFAGGKAQPGNLIEVDTATNSGAEAMRDIASRSNYKALGTSPVKTIICDEFHRASAAAWSSLLKPIEEPPEHVFWVFCTTETGKIPETIRNRCVTCVFKPVDELEIFGLLERVNSLEKLNTLPEVLEAIAENSSGSPRQALTNLELCAHAKTANEARELMRSALQMKGPVDLARLVLSKQRPAWAAVIKLIGSLENVDAETVRIVICNYIAAALMKATDNEAKRMLTILDSFSTPYQTSDKLAPLLLSIGLALGMDQ